MSACQEPLPIASRSTRRPISSLVLGWVGVSASVCIGCFWAFWGSIENFHEGWFHPSLCQNLELMVVQYLSPMLVIMITSSIALLWPRTALLLFGGTAVAVTLYFRHSRAAIVLIALPLVGLGLL